MMSLLAMHQVGVGIKVHGTLESVGFGKYASEYALSALGKCHFSIIVRCSCNLND